jgi:oligopeptide transport system permease protein
MATVSQPSKLPGSGITDLRERPKGESLWANSLRRLIRNRLAVVGFIIIVLMILMAVFAEQIAPYPYAQANFRSGDSAPLWVTRIFPGMIPEGQEGGYVIIDESYPLGADALGRDLLSRIIYGARVSLMVAFIGPLFAIAIGLVVGMAAGYFGGVVDNVLMRLVDIMYAFPTLLFIILLMTFFRFSTVAPEPGSLAAALGQFDKDTGGMLFIFVGIGLTSWMQMARLVRGQVLAAREQEYIVASRSIGSKTPRILWGHILPNILGPLIVAETLTIPTYISYEAFLSFIGLGVQQPTPSWGSMISEGANAIRSYPNQALFPAVALFLVMFAFNFLGDGLRDALDPRMRGKD